MKKNYVVVTLVLTAALLSSFKLFMNEQEWMIWTNRMLNESFDPLAKVKVKKFELMLTPDHFLRLRKSYQQGKQEYYSFNLKRFTEMNYLPGEVTDTLRFHTQADDIIYQTYNDPKGDIDSMATEMNVLVRKLPAARLDSLKQALELIKSKSM